MTEHSRQKILYCEGNVDNTVGGSYFSLLYLVSGLDKTRFEPIVIFHQANPLIPSFENAGIDTRVVEKPTPFAFTSPSQVSWPGYKVIYPALRVFQKFVNFIRFLPLTAMQYARLIRKNNVDLVHLNNSIVRNHAWMLAAQISGTKCVTHERGINSQYSRLARYYAKRISAVICISRAVRDNLKKYNVSASTLVTIYNGIDPTVLTVDRSEREIRGELGLSPDATLIGVVGNVKHWKGQETVIHAMPRIIEDNPDTVCLFIGDVSPSDQGYKDHLLEEISRLGLRSNVVFTGYVKDVANYLNALDVVLHTSIQPEPFGRVLIEAMSLRKPLIGAHAGAVPEIIDNGTTGLTFPPGDHVSLADRVKEVLGSPEKAKEMGDSAFERVRTKFHIRTHISEIEGLYDTILSG